MTIGELKGLIQQYKIPDETIMLSDSGWECSATDMDGVYYNAEKKIIVFTQYCSEYEDYDIRCQERKIRNLNLEVNEEFKGFVAIGKDE